MSVISRHHPTPILREKEKELTTGVQAAGLDGELLIRARDAEVEALVVVVGMRVVVGLLAALVVLAGLLGGRANLGCAVGPAAAGGGGTLLQRGGGRGGESGQQGEEGQERELHLDRCVVLCGPRGIFSAESGGFDRSAKTGTSRIQGSDDRESYELCGGKGTVLTYIYLPTYRLGAQ